MQAPKGLVSKTGETLNKGSIYLSETSSPMVFKAYLDQFKEDFTLFLRSRSEEIVPGGGMILTIVGRADQNNPKSIWEVLGRALYNMVLEVQVQVYFIFIFILFLILLSLIHLQIGT